MTSDVGRVDRGAPGRRARTILFGSDRLGQRVAEQLRRDDCEVFVVALSGAHLSGAASRPDLTVSSAAASDPETLRKAGIAEADVVMAVTDDDELNLAIALAAREGRPSVRLVLRQFNVRLGALLAVHLPDCVVLSLSALSAPTFAAAAIAPGVVFAHHVGGTVVVLREREGSAAPTPGARVVAVRGRDGVTWRDGAGTDSNPADQVLEIACLRDLPGHERRPSKAGREAQGLPSAFAGARAPRRTGPDRLLLVTLVAFVAVVAGATVLFQVRLGLSTLDAFYFVSTIVTTVGFGDFHLRDADSVTKLAGVATMFGGLGLSAVLIALLTNELVARRALVQRGRFRWGLADHVVVCGLGSIGLRIAATLQELGHEVVVIEADEQARFVPAARALGLKLVIGDAAQEESLSFANVGRARAVVAATASDHRNLEIGLSARSVAAGIPVVLRMFDPDLSRRVASAFDIQATFSGAALGAGRFTAFAVDGTRLCNLEFGGQPYALHQVVDGAGETLAACATRLGGTPLAVLASAGPVHFDRPLDTRVAQGERVLVLVRG